MMSVYDYVTLFSFLIGLILLFLAYYFTVLYAIKSSFKNGCNLAVAYYNKKNSKQKLNKHKK